MINKYYFETDKLAHSHPWSNPIVLLDKARKLEYAKAAMLPEEVATTAGLKEFLEEHLHHESLSGERNRVNIVANDAETAFNLVLDKLREINRGIQKVGGSPLHIVSTFTGDTDEIQKKIDEVRTAIRSQDDILVLGTSVGLNPEREQLMQGHTGNRNKVNSFFTQSLLFFLKDNSGKPLQNPIIFVSPNPLDNEAFKNVFGENSPDPINFSKVDLSAEYKINAFKAVVKALEKKLGVSGFFDSDLMKAFGVPIAGNDSTPDEKERYEEQAIDFVSVIYEELYKYSPTIKEFERSAAQIIIDSLQDGVINYEEVKRKSALKSKERMENLGTAQGEGRTVKTITEVEHVPEPKISDEVARTGGLQNFHWFASKITEDLKPVVGTPSIKEEERMGKIFGVFYLSGYQFGDVSEALPVFYHYILPDSKNWKVYNLNVRNVTGSLLGESNAAINRLLYGPLSKVKKTIIYVPELGQLEQQSQRHDTSSGQTASGEHTAVASSISTWLTNGVQSGDFMKREIVVILSSPEEVQNYNYQEKRPQASLLKALDQDTKPFSLSSRKIPASDLTGLIDRIYKSIPADPQQPYEKLAKFSLEHLFHKEDIAGELNDAWNIIKKEVPYLEGQGINAPQLRRFMNPLGASNFFTNFSAAIGINYGTKLEKMPLLKDMSESVSSLEHLTRDEKLSVKITLHPLLRMALQVPDFMSEPIFMPQNEGKEGALDIAKEDEQRSYRSKLVERLGHPLPAGSLVSKTIPGEGEEYSLNDTINTNIHDVRKKEKEDTAKEKIERRNRSLELVMTLADPRKDYFKDSIPLEQIYAALIDVKNYIDSIAPYTDVNSRERKHLIELQNLASDYYDRRIADTRQYESIMMGDLEETPEELLEEIHQRTPGYTLTNKNPIHEKLNQIAPETDPEVLKSREKYRRKEQEEGMK